MAPRLNRNGIPILDPPREANRLPRECEHFYVIVSRRYDHTDWMADEDYYRVEARCRYCGARRVRVE